MMQIYNTMTRKKEAFIPLEEGKIRLYTCGPTVYNYFHIGNARTFIFFDVMRRYFEFRGYEVTYVQNITDIDDKIIAQSLEEGIDFQQISAKYTAAFLDDSAALGIRPPDHLPKATDFVPQMIDLIAQLVEKGNAYEANGDVYFDTAALPEYGKLSGKKTEEQLAGARVEENYQKRHPADFTLWKRSKPGEPVWQSPWGEGRPGWHTECVVMSRQFLGETFDIHGGGIDLIFPHHENELAQAMALSGNPPAKYWMHNGFLNIGGEKMSKSLKNFHTARDILREYDAASIRFFFLSKHYRSPIDFDRELIAEADRAVKNLNSALKSVDAMELLDPNNIDDPSVEAVQEFTAAMDDDLNTAKALAVLFDLAHKTRNATLPMPERLNNGRRLIKLGQVLGFFADPEAILSPKAGDLSKSLIELIISYRNAARQNKDWASSDRFRDDLAALGIMLKDTKDGCHWSIEEPQ